MDPHKTELTLIILLMIGIVAAVVEMACDAYRPKTSLPVRLALIVALALTLIGAFMFGAQARDLDGRYAQSPLKPWFDSLRSGKGPCCSDADGYALSDVDWESTGQRYRVRIPKSNDEADKNILIWVEVPEDAVLTQPNRAGRTMVWPIWGNQGPSIRCFLPGSMT